jgi:aminobenzoyl-glutamate utilization protein B
LLGLLTFSSVVDAAPGRPDASAPSLTALKGAAVAEVERLAPLTQQMVDMVFSLGELGFQEVETSRYLTDVLRQHGFTITKGIAGIPTAWTARFGSGRPVIALGADIDGLPQTSQKPGVAFRAPLVEDGPGHGEGHNAGVPLQITAALALKSLMQKHHLEGTLLLWPGVAEEQLAAKAHYVRAGVFRDVDAVIFAHVDGQLRTFWGDAPLTGLVSVEYRFTGQSAHASAPWRGRSALDAVELMNVAWNFRREHLRLEQRSHYVITDGGDQPNVVPPTAAVWYYFRELDYLHIKELWEVGDKIAQAAALMTDTQVVSRVLGSAWPIHGNRPLAEAMHANMQHVGLPRWTGADQALARAVQKETASPVKGLAEVPEAKLQGPIPEGGPRLGGSDDIGDVSWSVPTVVLRYPANIPEIPFHHWSAAIAMATPIAHKGATTGAKVAAMTALDLLLKPGLVMDARTYFTDVQTKDVKYAPLLGQNDQPAVHLNRALMEQHRPALGKIRFDPKRYRTYLEQLGVKYPTLERAK